MILVDYGSIGKPDILSIHKYVMSKNTHIVNM